MLQTLNNHYHSILQFSFHQSQPVNFAYRLVYMCGQPVDLSHMLTTRPQVSPPCVHLYSTYNDQSRPVDYCCRRVYASQPVTTGQFHATGRDMSNWHLDCRHQLIHRDRSTLPSVRLSQAIGRPVIWSVVSCQLGTLSDWSNPAFDLSQQVDLASNMFASVDLASDLLALADLAIELCSYVKHIVHVIRRV